MSNAEKPHSELPSYGLDEVDEPAGWRRWLSGRRRTFVLVLAGLAIIVAFGARPAYRELKARRALSLAEGAGSALDRGEGAEASELLRQAALMAFDDERVSDLVTYHAARAGDLASVAEIGKKLDAGQASAGEILVFGERSLSAGRPRDARRALDALPSENLPAAETVRRAVLEAGLLSAQGQAAAAEAVLRQALPAAPDPGADRLRVTLANLLLSDADGKRAGEARELLEIAAEGDDEAALDARRVLAVSSAGISPGAQAELSAAIERLRAHPRASTADELLIARLVVSSDPARSGEAAKDLVSRLQQKQAPIDERVTAARWLIALPAHEAVLELMPADEDPGHAGALMVRLDALSGLGLWDECREAIETHRGGALPESLYHLFIARIAAATGDAEGAEEAKRELRRAVQFDELPHVLFVARYAEAVGWKREAFASWRILASDSGAKTEALRGQIRNLPPTATAADGLAVTRELLAAVPDDASGRLSAAYFALLTGSDLDGASATVEEFLTADPGSTDIRRVAALARLRGGQPDDGLALLPEDGGESRWLALRAALLRAAGQDAEATQLAAGVDPEGLLPEERAFLQQ